jgi:SAM-dependent methyltransferase
VITVDFDRVDIRPGDRVLDIGCGTGRHTAAVCDGRSVTVVGTDIGVGDLLEARERLGLHDRLGGTGQGTWHLTAADAVRLPFGNAAFDLVICSEVLEHIHDHRAAVAEALRVLKPGAQLVVSVPRYGPERLCWALSKAYSRQSGGHVRIYRKSRLVEMVTDAGAVFRGHHFAHALHSPYWWLKCIAGLGRPDPAPVAAYHRLLTWDIMCKPRLTRWSETLLNPVMGKSLVLYFRKSPAAP